MKTKIWIFYLNNFRIIHHIMTILVGIGIFYIGKLNLITLDIKMLPWQLIVLAASYFTANFSISYVKLEKTIEEEKDRLRKEGKIC